MIRADIKELHFITHIGNIPSIKRHGILSQHQVRRKKIGNRDISESGVQERREGKKIPGTKRDLHSYANLYFDAHNPMLSARRKNNSEICVLRIESDILDEIDVIITDKNAARNCWFKTVEEGLPLLEKQEIYARYWTDDDYLEQERKKGIKCAEVLVPDSVPPGYILGAYVANESALSYFRSVSDIPVEINRSMFF